MNDPPKYIIELLEKLSRAGYESFLAGGCVRDLLRSKRPKDFDVATPAAPDEVKNVFRRVLDTGIRHGTVTVLFKGHPVELTTFRTEGGYWDHRRPETVRFEADINLDLSRRDFTINAMALDKNGRLLDPFDGQNDLTAGVIRAVGDARTRFREDALRMLRAFRFSAVLGFEIEEKTLDAIREFAPLVEYLSAERIREELTKMLLSERPDVIGRAAEYGLFEPYLPRHLPSLKGLSRLPKNSASRLAAFIIAVQPEGAEVFAAALLEKLKFDLQTRRLVIGTLSVCAAYPAGDPAIKMAIYRHGAEAVLAASAINGRRKPSAVRRILASGECVGLDSLSVNGEDLIRLGIPVGRELGNLLKYLLYHVFEHPDENKKDILLNIVIKEPLV